MLKHSSFVVLLTALLGALPASAESLYTKKSPVLQVDATNYDRLIARSNHVSIVEFYAPWCGHCQNLKPAYEKAAKSLEGLAKVAAVNCDDEANKSFCGIMRIQGFPTLRMVIPSDKPGKPKHEDYKGPRTAKGIVDAVVEKIPNRVKRLTDKNIDDWLTNSNETAKAILFTEKGTTSALLRALAIDFHGKIQIGQIRNKETSAVDMFGVTKFPTFVLLPGSDKPSVVYDGELKKKPMLEFLSQVAEPNQDPPPLKKSSPQKPKKPTTTAGDTATDKPTESANDSTDPREPKKFTASERRSQAEEPKVPQLRVLSTTTDLRTTCLSSKTGTCILAIVPVPSDPNLPPSMSALQALNSLSDIERKHALRHARLFPFYVAPDDIEEVPKLRDELGLKSDIVEIIAINGKRGWWRRYDSADGSKYGVVDLEKWVDQVRMGEAEKHKIPEGALLSESKEEPKAEPEVIPEQEPEKEPEQEPEQEPEAPPQDEPEEKTEKEPEHEPEATPSATPETEPQQETTESPKEPKTAVHEEL
ncbi:Thioredoxin domain containing protein [Coccidioides posadasii C735 delta SOWgp]|uniref:protein disulfide-isomerase n=1 Tax=Coccidioides posadasii (strain C735) TaxID=222929 RepID=C5P0Y6_COCP7|nr:Thioredoxin domain containing protein [Coccidioides posadasii C735 delta SOWgp]EER29344.1 Thioredoxin domain containing protein [Coccidioides posadasii C735 delta SOWgp]|eukprot:XP_003071489.1 Thioredoxin domain containing protein [Coccidioides posadasii C735 delta SOWgp]